MDGASEILTRSASFDVARCEDVRIFGLKGRHKTARGNAPGFEARPRSFALKGRDRIVGLRWSEAC